MDACVHLVEEVHRARGPAFVLEAVEVVAATEVVADARWAVVEVEAYACSPWVVVEVVAHARSVVLPFHTHKGGVEVQKPCLRTAEVVEEVGAQYQKVHDEVAKASPRTEVSLPA